MDRNDNYEDIIDLPRPWPMDILRKHPKMSPQDRAKIFAPFAALRGHSERLGEEDVKLMWSKRTELSEEEAEILSDKLLQVKKSMTVTVVYFQPDSASVGSKSGDVGYDVTATGVVKEVDVVYRALKVNTGRGNPKSGTHEKPPVDDVIKFDDLLDVSGEGIVDIDSFLGIEDRDFPADE